MVLLITTDTGVVQIKARGHKLTDRVALGNRWGRSCYRVQRESLTKVAELVSLPYAQYARLILKVSHNLGANLSLMFFGLT